MARFAIAFKDSGFIVNKFLTYSTGKAEEIFRNFLKENIKSHSYENLFLKSIPRENKKPLIAIFNCVNLENNLCFLRG